MFTRSTLAGKARPAWILDESLNVGTELCEGGGAEQESSGDQTDL